MEKFAKRALIPVAFIIVAAAGLVMPRKAQAGYFEISANGSYYKYNNGTTLGDQNFTITRRMGGGLAYRFLSNTAIELSYSDQLTKDTLTQTTAAGDIRLRTTKETNFRVTSLDLLLYFSGPKAAFRPYVRVGGGYTERSVRVRGTQTDTLTLQTFEIAADYPKIYSMSAQIGAGLTISVANRLALEGTYTAYATELDQPIIYIHYSVSGGLRYIF